MPDRPLPDPALTPEGVPIPVFSPWRAQRERVGGWLPAMQRAFIAELTRIGSAHAAAQAVGMSVRSAYVLRDKPGAESFAAAWEEALSRGRGQVRQVAIERALHGELVPRFRAGRFMGYHLRHNDRLIMGVLASARAGDQPGDQPGDDMRYRLERWEAALRRTEMDQADAKVDPADTPDEAWDAHVLWQQELKAEKRRQRRAEIRSEVRKAMARRDPVGPRVRAL